jgi:hypothetical protein
MTPAGQTVAAAADAPHHKRRASHRLYLRRQLLGIGIAVAVLAFSLAVGMWGYHHFEGESWRDAFLNSSMLLGGEGPIAQQLSPGGKLFAGFYALYSGLIVIAVAGLMLAPGVHHLMRLVHIEEHEMD